MNTAWLLGVLLLGGPESVTLLSANKELVDSGGESYVRVTSAAPAKFELAGPGKYQVGFRLILLSGATTEPSGVLTIVADGKSLKAYRIAGKPGSAAWKDDASIKASLDTTFLIETTAKESWEIRLQGADPLGGAVSVVAADKAKRPASASAPVLKSAASAVASAPVPSATVAAAAAATPAATPAPANVARPAAGGAMLVSARVLAYSRFAAKRFGPLAPGFSVDATKAFSPQIAAGASLGWRHMSGDRTAAEYAGRVLPPYVVDVDAIPIEALARWSSPLASGTLGVHASAGLEYARSSHKRANDVPRRTMENDWAPTAALGASFARPMGGGALSLVASGRFARHAFAAHDFDVLHGIEIGAGWSRSF